MWSTVELVNQIYRAIHRKLKTHLGFRYAVQEIQFAELGQPIQSAFYAPNAISILEELPGVGRRTLVKRQLERKKRTFSVRNLTGLDAGKTPGDIHVDTFLDHGRALKPRSEYQFRNWIGFETEEDFRTNCEYLRGKLSWIAGNDDGVPVIAHREWDNCYYLINIDGANHFAAVYRQCIEQSRDFTFECRIEHHRLDEMKCRKALEHSAALILRTPDAEKLKQLLKEFNLHLLPYCPEFQEGKSVLLLGWFARPRLYDVYETLREVIPPKSYFDLSEYVLGLL